MNILKAWLKRNLKGDPIVWGIAFVLAIISTLVVYSASGSLAYRRMHGNTEHYLIKHFSLLVISIFAMWVTHKVDYRYYAPIAKLALWITVPLLIFTWKYGATINAASRWITIPFLNKTFQSSDLAEIALIIYFANMLAKLRRGAISIEEGFFPMVGWCGAVCGLIALTNLSTAIILFSTCILLMFLGSLPMKYIGACLLVAISVGGVAALVGQRGTTAVNRIKAFTKGETHFQTQQSYIAIANGGLYGKGPGKSQQRNFLPHPYSDFIFAVLIEEYGLLGGLFVLILYLILLYRGIAAINRCHRSFGGLLTAGISFSLVLQALVNMGVAVGLGPVTGLPLPFLSMGGTSLLFTGISLGIIISISRGETDRSLNKETTQNSPRNQFKNPLPSQESD